MKVCIIGDISEPLDEGMKKTAHALATALSEQCQVLTLNPLSSTRLDFWLALRRFRPNIVHYVPGPTLRSFILLNMIKWWTSAITVMTLSHPDPKLPKNIARLFKPDMLCPQSLRAEKEFEGLGISMNYVPNGVNLKSFKPVSKEDKMRLRAEYGLSETDFVVLHVGNTRQVRNLDILTKIKDDGCQVVVVSSTTIKGDTEVTTRLINAGCLIWNQYIKAIEEVYALADCYVFPTQVSIAAIEHPLSVLEAMACNLPVVTKKFGALPRSFSPGDGLFFVDTDEELRAVVKHIKQSNCAVNTQRKVAKLDWQNIARQLIVMYERLLHKV